MHLRPSPLLWPFSPLPSSGLLSIRALFTDPTDSWNKLDSFDSADQLGRRQPSSQSKKRLYSSSTVGSGRCSWTATPGLSDLLAPSNEWPHCAVQINECVWVWGRERENQRGKVCLFACTVRVFVWLLWCLSVCVCVHTWWMVQTTAATPPSLSAVTLSLLITQAERQRGRRPRGSFWF